MKKRIFVCFLIFITCLFYFSIPGTVFGQSPAEMVIANYKETLLREDIRPLLPDVLRAFDTFEGNLIPLSIKIYLDKPIFLRKVDPNIDEFIARLYVDDDLRTLFADGQFYNVLKNSDEIAKLKDWLLPEPMELKYVSGNSQEGLINTRLLDALVVQVRDQHDKPIAGIQVNFSVPKGNGMLSDKTAMTDQMGKASVTLTLGSEAGENSVVASVAGTSLTQTFTATAIAVDESPKPTTPSIVSGTDEAIDADVNGDGVVNIIDLSIVLAFIGNPDRSMEAIDEDVDADINEDEVVNYEDLILILSVLEPAAAAPSVHALVKIGVSAADVRVLLTQAKALPEAIQADPVYQRGIVGLERLLAILTEVPAVPKQTALLVNYPNPFNPETWIPYRLSEASDVKVSIYAVDGRLIRTLALGHQPAGLYQRKPRAAYWDGRNEFGEPVASGVYFYTLTAGDFTATRKMLIRK